MAKKQSPLLAKAGVGAVPFFAGMKAQVPLKEPKPQYWYDLQSLEAAQAEAQSIWFGVFYLTREEEREKSWGERERVS